MALIRKWACDSGVTLNGSDAQAWLDSVVASELLQATGSKQPTQITDANGWTPLRFAGVEEMFLATTTELDFTTGTMFAIACVKRATTAPSLVVCAKGTEGNNTQWQLYFGTGGNLGKAIGQWIESAGNYRGRTATTAVSADAIQTGAVSYTMGDSNNNAYTNGVLDNGSLLTSGTAPSTTTNAKKFGVGNFEGGASFGLFDLYELRLYDALPADVPAIHTELYDRYNNPANTDPQLDTNLPDDTLQVGQSLSINLNSYFSDADSDPLTYTGTRNGGAFPSGWTIVGSTLTILAAPSQLGSNTVAISADDGGGGTPATDSFTLTVVNPEFPLYPIGGQGRADIRRDRKSQSRWHRGIPRF